MKKRMRKKIKRKRSLVKAIIIMAIMRATKKILNI